LKMPADNVPVSWYVIGAILAIALVLLVRFIVNG
jgi:hypothetical protein